jgi:hypothetical protein
VVKLKEQGDSHVRASVPRLQTWEAGGQPPIDRATIEAIVAICADLRLLRRYTTGPLAGHTLTADTLTRLLEDAAAEHRHRHRRGAKEHPDEDLPDGNPRTERWWRRYRTSIAIGTVCTIMAVVGLGIAAVAGLDPPLAAARAMLSSPVGCPLVSHRVPISTPPDGITAGFQYPRPCSIDLPAGEAMTASGPYTGDLSQNVVWLVVAAPGGDLYPQSASACVPEPARLQGDQWTTKLQLSEPGRPTEQFDLVLGIAPTEGETSQRFRQWLRDGCADPNKFSHGFTAAPGDFAEVASITVATRGREER